MLEGVSLRDMSIRNISVWGGGERVSVTVPDDQGFHEEIQFILFGTHLRQRLGAEGEKAVSSRSERQSAESMVCRESPSYLHSHLQGARIVGRSRHLTFVHLPKRAMAQTPVQRRREDEAEASGLGERGRGTFSGCPREGMHTLTSHA